MTSRNLRRQQARRQDLRKQEDDHDVSDWDGSDEDDDDEDDDEYESDEAGDNGNSGLGKKKSMFSSARWMTPGSRPPRRWSRTQHWSCQSARPDSRRGAVAGLSHASLAQREVELGPDHEL